MMTKQEYKAGNAKAIELVGIILDAYYFGIGIEVARKAQQSLIVWVNIIKEGNYIYNGLYDEYLKLKI